MKRTFVGVLSGCALIAGGLAMQRASAQESTQYPGQPTRATVWIQNRGTAEAIPVSIESTGTAPPLRVEVAGIPRVTMDPGTALQVRTTRQSWSYRAVSIGAGQDLVAPLNTAGADGWETTGIALSSGGTTVILMKRAN